MTRDPAIQTRVSPELKKQLERVAKQDNRSVSAYLKLLIADHLSQETIVNPRPFKKSNGHG